MLFRDPTPHVDYVQQKFHSQIIYSGLKPLLVANVGCQPTLATNNGSASRNSVPTTYIAQKRTWDRLNSRIRPPSDVDEDMTKQIVSSAFTGAAAKAFASVASEFPKVTTDSW